MFARIAFAVSKQKFQNQEALELFQESRKKQKLKKKQKYKLNHRPVKMLKDEDIEVKIEVGSNLENEVENKVEMKVDNFGSEIDLKIPTENESKKSIKLIEEDSDNNSQEHSQEDSGEHSSELMNRDRWNILVGMLRKELLISYLSQNFKNYTKEVNKKFTVSRPSSPFSMTNGFLFQDDIRDKNALKNTVEDRSHSVEENNLKENLSLNSISESDFGFENMEGENNKNNDDNNDDYNDNNNSNSNNIHDSIHTSTIDNNIVNEIDSSIIHNTPPTPPPPTTAPTPIHILTQHPESQSRSQSQSVDQADISKSSQSDLISEIDIKNEKTVTQKLKNSNKEENNLAHENNFLTKIRQSTSAGTVERMKKNIQNNGNEFENGNENENKIANGRNENRNKKSDRNSFDNTDRRKAHNNSNLFNISNIGENVNQFISENGDGNESKILNNYKIPTKKFNLEFNELNFQLLNNELKNNINVNKKKNKKLGVYAIENFEFSKTIDSYQLNFENENRLYDDMSSSSDFNFNNNFNNNFNSNCDFDLSINKIDYNNFSTSQIYSKNQKNNKNVKIETAEFKKLKKLFQNSKNKMDNLKEKIDTNISVISQSGILRTINGNGSKMGSKTAIMYSKQSSVKK